MSQFLLKHFMPREIPALARGIANLKSSQYEISAKTTRKTTPITGTPITAIQAILSVVSEIWDTDAKSILGQSRRQPMAKARQVSILMTREFTQLTDAQIAKVFGKSESIVRKCKFLVSPAHAESAREAVKTALK